MYRLENAIDRLAQRIAQGADVKEEASKLAVTIREIIVAEIEAR